MNAHVPKPFRSILNGFAAAAVRNWGADAVRHEYAQMLADDYAVAYFDQKDAEHGAKGGDE